MSNHNQLDPVTHLPQEPLTVDQFFKAYPRKGKIDLQPSIYSGGELTEYDSDVGPFSSRDYFRAENQSGWEALGNGILRVSNVIPGIIQNVASLEDMLGSENVRGNALYDAMQAWIDATNNAAPIHQNPDAFIGGEDISGLFNSILEFAVTGLGTGAAMSALTKAARMGTLGKTIAGIDKLDQHLATLGTATLLNRMEAHKESKSVYDRKYQESKAKGYSEELSRKMADQAADLTEKINWLNLPLNLTSAGLFVKGSQYGFRPLVKEVTVKNTLKQMGYEIPQEGLEEDVNLFAEQAGLQYDGGPVNYGKVWDKVFSREGLKSFILGGLGALGQTSISAGLGNIKVGDVYEGKFIKQRAAFKEQQDLLTHIKNNFKREDLSKSFLDLVEFSDIQAKISKLQEEGHPEEAAKLKEQLFADRAYRAFEINAEQGLVDYIDTIIKDGENITQEEIDNANRAKENLQKYRKFYDIAKKTPNPETFYYLNVVKDQLLTTIKEKEDNLNEINKQVESLVQEAITIERKAGIQDAITFTEQIRDKAKKVEEAKGVSKLKEEIQKLYKSLTDVNLKSFEAILNIDSKKVQNLQNDIDKAGEEAVKNGEANPEDLNGMVSEKGTERANSQAQSGRKGTSISLQKIYERDKEAKRTPEDRANNIKQEIDRRYTNAPALETEEMKEISQLLNNMINELESVHNKNVQSLQESGVYEEMSRVQDNFINLINTIKNGLSTSVDLTNIYIAGGPLVREAINNYFVKKSAFALNEELSTQVNHDQSNPTDNGEAEDDGESDPSNPYFAIVKDRRIGKNKDKEYESGVTKENPDYDPRFEEGIDLLNDPNADLKGLLLNFEYDPSSNWNKNNKSNLENFEVLITTVYNGKKVILGKLKADQGLDNKGKEIRRSFFNTEAERKKGNTIKISNLTSTFKTKTPARFATTEELAPISERLNKNEPIIIGVVGRTSSDGVRLSVPNASNFGIPEEIISVSSNLKPGGIYYIIKDNRGKWVPYKGYVKTLKDTDLVDEAFSILDEIVKTEDKTELAKLYNKLQSIVFIGNSENKAKKPTFSLVYNHKEKTFMSKYYYDESKKERKKVQEYVPLNIEETKLLLLNSIINIDRSKANEKAYNESIEKYLLTDLDFNHFHSPSFLFTPPAVRNSLNTEQAIGQQFTSNKDTVDVNPEGNISNITQEAQDILLGSSSPTKNDVDNAISSKDAPAEKDPRSTGAVPQAGNVGGGDVEVKADIEKRKQGKDNKIENIVYNNGVFEGSFLDNYEFIAEGSESRVYRSKDGTHVIKISEPYNSKDEILFNSRITNNLLREILGNSGLEVIGYYEHNGVKNPVYKQNYIEGKTLSEKEVASYLKTIKGVIEIDGKFYYKYDSKLYAISDFSDNVIQDKNGNIVPIDLDIYEVTDNKINAKYDAEAKAVEQSPQAGSVVGGDIEAKKAGIVQTYEYKGKTQTIKKQTSTKDGITKVTFIGERSDKPGVSSKSGYVYGGVTSNPIQQFFDDYGVTVEDIAEDLSINDIKAIQVVEERTSEGITAITFRITYSEEMGGMSSEPMEMAVKKQKFTSDAELASLEGAKPAETYKGIQVIDSSSIKTATGEPGAAQYNRAENKILVNRELLKKKFDEKAWTKPRKQKDGSFATALPEDAFATYEEFEKFVIEHEFQHSLLSYQESGAKTVGEYEDIINRRAFGEGASVSDKKANIEKEYSDLKSKKGKGSKKPGIRSFTGEYTRKANLDKELEKLRKVLGPDYVKIVPGLKRIIGHDLWGAFKDGIAYIHEDAPEGVSYHEAFHIVFNTMLNDKQREALLKEASTKYPLPNNYELVEIARITGVTDKNELIKIYYEEKIAEAYRWYSLNQDNVSSNFLQKFFDIIRLWFKNILNGKLSMVDTFQAMERGMYRRKNVKPLKRKGSILKASRKIEGLKPTQITEAKHYMFYAYNEILDELYEKFKNDGIEMADDVEIINAVGMNYILGAIFTKIRNDSRYHFDNDTDKASLFFNLLNNLFNRYDKLNAEFENEGKHGIKNFYQTKERQKPSSSSIESNLDERSFNALKSLKREEPSEDERSYNYRFGITALEDDEFDEMLFAPNAEYYGPLTMEFFKYLRDFGINISITSSTVKGEVTNLEEYLIDKEISLDENADVKENWQFSANRQSSREKASAKLKRKFSTIPVEHKNKSNKIVPVSTIYDYYKYESFDEIYRYLEQNISDTYSVPEMMAKVKTLAKSKRFMKHVLNMLQNDEGLRTDLFTNVASKTFDEYVSVRLYENSSYDSDDVETLTYALRFFQSNKLNIRDQIIENIKSDFQRSIIYEGGKINIKRAKEFKKLIKELQYDITKDSNLMEIEDTSSTGNIRFINILTEDAAKDIQKRLAAYGFIFSTDQLIGLSENTTLGSFFSDTNGLGRIASILESGENPFEIIEYKVDYKASDESTLLDNIAVMLKPVSRNTFESSFRSATGETYYSHRNSAFIHKQVKALKNQKLLEQYLEMPYYRKSPLLNDIKNNPSLLEDFKVTIFDAFTPQNQSEGIPYTQMNSMQLNLSKIVLYAVNSKAKIAYYPTGILSNAPKMHFVKARKYKIDEVKEKLFQTILQEYDRISYVRQNKEVFQEENSNSSFLKNAMSYNYFTFMNKSENRSLDPSNDNHKEKIMSQLDAFMDELFQRQLKELEEQDIIYKNINNEYSSLLLNESLINKEKSDTDFLREWYYNSFYMNTQLTDLFTGDQSVYKNIADIMKRNKAISSPRLLGNIHATFKKIVNGKEEVFTVNKSYAAVILKDSKAATVNKELKEIFESNLRASGKYTDTEIKNIVEVYDTKNKNAHNITDAQSFTTMERSKEIEVMFNKWNNKKEKTYFKIKGNKQLGKGDANTFEVRKPFVFQHWFFKKGDTEYVFPLQFKNSEATLNPLEVNQTNEDGSYKYPELKKIYDALQAIQEKTGLRAVLHFESASKAYTPFIFKNADDLYSYVTNPKNGKLLDGNKILRLNNSDYGIQQEVPEHFLDATNNLGVQIKKLMEMDIADNVIFDKSVLGNALQLFENKTSVEFIEIKEQLAQLFSELMDLNYNTTLSDINTSGKFYQKLRSLHDEKRSSINFIDALSKDGDNTYLPIWFPQLSKKNEQVSTSIFKNGVTKTEFNGPSFANKSSIGYQDDLKIGFDEKGMYIEAILPWWSKEFFSAALDSKDKKHTIDSIKNKEILEMIAYRIPTEHRYSMFRIKVKEFSDQTFGGSIILPNEITTIAGLDFDIDKLYSMIYNMKVDKKGNITVPRDNTKEGLQNKILDIYLAILSHPDLMRHQLAPGGFEDFKRRAYEISLVEKGFSFDEVSKMTDDEIKEVIDNDNDLNWSDNYSQNRMFENNMAGNSLIGYFANHNTSHSLSQGTDLQIDSLPNITFNNKVIKSLSQVFDKAGNYISKNIATYLSAVVDNAKFPLANYVNLNVYTVDTFNTMLRAGFTKSYTELLISQPILKEFVASYFKAGASIFSENKIFDKVKQELIDKIERDLDILKQTVYEALEVSNIAENASEQQLVEKDQIFYNKVKNVKRVYIDFSENELKNIFEESIKEKKERPEKPIEEDQLKNYNDQLEKHNKKYQKLFEQQYAIIDNFFILKSAANDLAKVTTYTKTDNTANKTSISELEIEQERLQRLETLKYIKNVDTLLSKPLISLYRKYSINNVSEFLSNYFPWGNKTLAKIKNNLNREKLGTVGYGLTSEEIDTINYQYVNWLVTDSNFYALDDNSRKDLFLKFPKEFHKFINEDFPKMIEEDTEWDPSFRLDRFLPLLTRLQVKYHKINKVKLLRIEYYGRGIKVTEEDDLIRLFEEMLTVPELKEIAENLIRYSFSTSGFNVTPFSFNNLFPVSFYKNLDVAFEKSFIQSLKDKMNNTNADVTIEAANFEEQFMRHFFHAHSYLKTANSSNAIIKRNIIYIPQKQFLQWGISVDDISTAPRWIKYGSSDNPRLFEVVINKGFIKDSNGRPQVLYRRKSTLGIKNWLLEYDYNKIEPESIIKANNVAPLVENQNKVADEIASTTHKADPDITLSAGTLKNLETSSETSTSKQTKSTFKQLDMFEESVLDMYDEANDSLTTHVDVDEDGSLTSISSDAMSSLGLPSEESVEENKNKCRKNKKK